MRSCVILTGTIVPNTRKLTIRDPEIRAREYAHTIGFYLQELPYDIYFLENSSYDIENSPIFEEVINNERFHLKRFAPIEQEKGHDPGKGHQEFYKIDLILDDLKDHYDRLIKVTGRYLVKNIKDLTAHPSNRPVMDQHAPTKGRDGITITSFFVCPIPFYLKHIKGAYKDVDDERSRSIEKVVYERLLKVEPEESPALFPKNPIFEGLSGTSGGSLRRNPWKMRFRNLERKVLRSFGKNRFYLKI